MASGVIKASITGGTIADNTADGMTDPQKGKGKNIYVDQTKNLALSPSEDLNGIFLYLGASLLIPSALKHRITLEGAYSRNTAMPGLLVASATSGYALTDTDLSKFSYQDNDYGFALAGDQIKLAEFAYPVPFNLTGMKGSGSTPLPASVEKGKDLIVRLIASAGYKLPADTVTVKVGDANITANQYVLQNYPSACSILIRAAQITGSVEITAAAVKKGSNAQLSGLTYYKQA